MRTSPSCCFVNGFTRFLIVAVCTTSPVLFAADTGNAGYRLTTLNTLGKDAPGGGTLVNDFEPSAITNSGYILFGADLSSGGEGVFLGRKSDLSAIARSGLPAPGGGMYDVGFMGPATINEGGDGGFVFLLSPFTFPLGTNAGVYRFSGTQVQPVVIPYVTSAPGGGTFQGSYFSQSINSRGDLLFSGIIQTANGIHVPGEPYTGVGMGLFKSVKSGTILPVVVPGDAAPGGGTFDWASLASENDSDDVALTAHVAGEECGNIFGAPQATFIGCLGSIYIKTFATGTLLSIAHQGSPAPGGGIFRQTVSPILNNRGDVAFLGDLTPPPGANQVMGVYVYSGGKITRIAGPGDAMPGGGKFVTASNIVGNQIHVNNRGEVVFNAVLDTDINGDGSSDTGLYAWSSGSLRTVARTGTPIAGGTIQALASNVLVIPPPPVVVPNSGAVNNDRGEVLFAASAKSDSGEQFVALLLATPAQ